MASIATNTELVLINASNPGTINLPSASQGRVLNFKDVLGTFRTNVLTLVCGNTDTFEDGSTSKILKEKNGILQIVGSGTKWYVLNGTQQNTINVSTLQCLNLSTNSISTSSATVSTLNFQNSLYNKSTLMYFNSNVVMGTRVWPTQIFTNKTYTILATNYPKTISGLAVWLDAYDASTITLTGSNVTQWNDKSGNGKNAISASGTITYNLSPINNMPTITFAAGSSLQFAITYTTTFRNVFAVVTIGGLVNGSSYCVIGQYTGTSTVPAQVIAGYSAGLGDIQFSTYNRQILITTSPPSGFYNNTSILCTTTSTGNVGIFVNGSSQGLATNNAGGSVFTAGSATQYINSRASLPLIIGEIIIYDGIITSTQQQKIEGYLAWKWNLVYKLPANHPYKYIPP